jgi:hypothetical protein
MTSFAHITYSFEHPGVARVEAAVRASREIVADIRSSSGSLAAVLRVTAWIGQSVSAALERWAQERRRAREEEKLWEMALRDPRVMADIRCARG